MMSFAAGIGGYGREAIVSFVEVAFIDTAFILFRSFVQPVVQAEINPFVLPIVLAIPGKAKSYPS